MIHTQKKNFKKIKKWLSYRKDGPLGRCLSEHLSYMWEGLPKEESQESRHSGATWEMDRGDLPLSSSQILLP